MTRSARFRGIASNRLAVAVEGDETDAREMLVSSLAFAYGNLRSPIECDSRVAFLKTRRQISTGESFTEILRHRTAK